MQYLPLKYIKCAINTCNLQKNLLKLFNNTHVFELNISEKTFSVLTERMVAELSLTDPLTELAVGDFIALGVYRSESYNFESSRLRLY